jgi:sugar lactone lactonase YvrE
MEINLPVTQPTCVGFGGHDLKLLAVNTATEDLSDSEMAVQPSAGALLIFETAYKGLPESRYRKT